MKCSIFFNSSNPQNLEVLKNVERVLKENLINFEKICVLRKCRGKINSDFAISIGGDGTVLWASHYLVERDIPLIAVKAGGLGFLSSVEVENFNSFMENYLKGKYRVINRTVLKVISKKRSFFALNDCVVKSSDLRMFYCDVFYDEEFISSYFSDGVIVSTPTGSTAYNLSAMGPIVHPHSKVMLLTPISSHTLTHRSLVLPETTRIKINVRAKNSSKVKNIYVSIDGQKNFAFDGELIISIYEKTFKTIVSENYSYFDILRKKLSWGERLTSNR